MVHIRTCLIFLVGFGLACGGKDGTGTSVVASQEKATATAPAIPRTAPRSSPARPVISWHDSYRWLVSSEAEPPPSTLRVLRDEPMERTTLTSARDPSQPGIIWERFEYGDGWERQSLSPAAVPGTEPPDLAGTLLFHVGWFPRESYESGYKGVWAIAQPGNTHACVLALPEYLTWPDYVPESGEDASIPCRILPVMAAAETPTEPLSYYRVLHYLWRCPGTEAPCLTYGSTVEREAFEARVESPWSVVQVNPASVQQMEFDPLHHRPEQRWWQGTVETQSGTVTWFVGEASLPIFLQYPGRRLTAVGLSYDGPGPSSVTHAILNGSLGLLVVKHDSGIGFARVTAHEQTVEFFPNVGAEGIEVSLRHEWDSERTIGELPTDWEYVDGEVRPARH